MGVNGYNGEAAAPWITYRWIDDDDKSFIVARGPFVRWQVPVEQFERYHPLILACETRPKHLQWLKDRLRERRQEAEEAGLLP